MNPHDTEGSAAFELRFQSLFNEGRALAFPCDSHGEVDLEALSVRARENLRRAWSAIGRDYAMPAIEARTLH